MTFKKSLCNVEISQLGVFLEAFQEKNYSPGQQISKKSQTKLTTKDLLWLGVALLSY